MSNNQFGVVYEHRQGRRRLVPRSKSLVFVGDQVQLSEVTSGYYPEAEGILNTQVVCPVEPISPVGVSDRNSEANLVHGTGSHGSTHLSREDTELSLLATKVLSWSFLPARLAHPTLQEDIREHLLRMIDEVEQRASEPDWDGEGAVPLEAGTVAVARELVGCFPPLKVTPEVLASPRGEIDFDWDIDRRVSLIVCVCGPPRHDIVFLATNGGAEVRGREPWEGELPQLVRCCFERMKGYL